jgi:hypothetical protein
MWISLVNMFGLSRTVELTYAIESHAALNPVLVMIGTTPLRLCMALHGPLASGSALAQVGADGAGEEATTSEAQRRRRWKTSMIMKLVSVWKTRSWSAGANL